MYYQRSYVVEDYLDKFLLLILEDNYNFSSQVL